MQGRHPLCQARQQKSKQINFMVKQFQWELAPALMLYRET